MKLNYRGINYDYTPPSLEVKESEITGYYRGRPIHFPYSAPVSIRQPVANLTYRGVHYSSTPAGTIEAVVPSPAALSSNQSPHRARRLALRQAAESHRHNIQRSLEHRLTVAHSQQNQWLIQQLEEELQQSV